MKDPLSLTDALMKDLLAVMGQSIASDLKAFRDHHDRLDALVDTRHRMAEIGVRLSGRLLAADAPQDAPGTPPRLPSMLRDYRARQSEWFVRPIVAAMMREITSLPPRLMPETWKKELGPGSRIEVECRDEAARKTREKWGEADLPPAGGCLALARYGLAAHDGAKATVIAMLRAAFVLACNDDDRNRLATTLGQVHDSLGRPNRSDVQQIVSRAIRAGIEQQPPRKLPALAEDIAATLVSRLRVPPRGWDSYPPLA